MPALRESMRDSTKVTLPKFFSENVFAVTMKFTQTIYISFAIKRMFSQRFFAIYNTL
jgi:hypothetical protein